MANNANMAPLEAAKMVYDCLKDKEKEKFIEYLNLPEVGEYEELTKCERDGHRYKKLIEHKPMWMGLVGGKSILFCESCGGTVTIPTGV